MSPSRHMLVEHLPAMAAFLADLIRLPPRWRGQLAEGCFFQLLDETERQTARGRQLLLPANWIVRLVRLRVRYSRNWRRNRCLLGGLLLYHFLPRAGCVVTFNLGCRLRDGRVAGHCWVLAPGVTNLHEFQDAAKLEPIVSRTLNLETRN